MMKQDNAPPAGIIGAGSVWPYTHWKLRSGNIIYVARGIKMGIVNVNVDGTIPVAFFGPDPEADSISATLRLGEPVRHAYVTVTVLETQLTDRPRWIRILAETDESQR